MSRNIANWKKQSGPQPSLNSCVGPCPTLQSTDEQFYRLGDLHLAGKQGIQFGHFLNHFLLNSDENICCGTSTIWKKFLSFFKLPFLSQLFVSSGDTNVSTLFAGCNTERRSHSERFNQCSYWLISTYKKKNKLRRSFHTIVKGEK